MSCGPQTALIGEEVSAVTHLNDQSDAGARPSETDCNSLPSGVTDPGASTPGEGIDLESCRGGDPVDLDGEEVARRVATLIWQADPDDELLQAARDGELNDRDAVECQARRMLDDPRGASGFAAFFDAWLRLDPLRTPPETRVVADTYTQLLQETEDLLLHVALSSEPTLLSLLTTEYAELTEDTAEFYGVSIDDSELPNHPGFLTRGYFATSAPTASARGHFIAGRFLCAQIASPPLELHPHLTEEELMTTTRASMEQHVNDPACAGCHDTFDPVGFVFGQYDARGAFSPERNGQLIDVSGSLVPFGASDPADFVGPRGFASVVKETSEVLTCLATQVERHAAAIAGKDADGQEASTNSLSRFSEGNLVELMVAAAISDALLVDE